MTLVHDRRGTGEPLVLIHGVGSRWEIFTPVLDRLAQERDVIAVSLPGFGDCPPEPAEPTVANLTTRVEQFFAEVGVERPHVGGNSMGGAIALELARRGSVRTATAVSPVGFWTPRERAFCQASLTGTGALLRVLRPVAPALLKPALMRRALVTQVFARGDRQSVAELLTTVDGFIGSQATPLAIAAFSGYRFERPEELRDVPLTVAWGTRDFLLIPRQAERARRELPWARHIALDGLGHTPFADDPEMCAQVLLDGSAA